MRPIAHRGVAVRRAHHSIIGRDPERSDSMSVTDTTAARQAARRNNYGAVLSALRGLLAAFPEDLRDAPEYQAARHLVRTNCRSCGEPQFKSSLFRACWEAFSQQDPPFRPAA